MSRVNYLMSLVVPVYDEARGLEGFNVSLLAVLDKCSPANYEIIYCDDGSSDESPELVSKLHTENPAIKLLRLTRNFGKELAVTAGIQAANGQAIVVMDGDGQHPPELIPELLGKWRQGSQVVIGVRTTNQSEGLLKRLGSKLFQRLYGRITGIKLPLGSSDYRLIDRSVQQEFIRLSEHGRTTRGLIDWLGYSRSYVEFAANARQHGRAGYSFKKLCKLAVDSIVSASTSPLYYVAYMGGVILPLSLLLGVLMLANAAIGDPLSLHATGSAFVVVLILFLTGVLLVSQGIIGLYLSHIYVETQGRPLFIIDKERSRGF